VSYDYLMVKASAQAPANPTADADLEAVMLAFADAFSGEPIGTLDAVKASLQQLFPTLRWHQQRIELAPHALAAGLGDWSWSTVGGADAPVFSLGADDGQVRMIAASRVERSELGPVARTLGLMVLDEQTLEILTG
jgi:hypothetical protein